MTTPWEQLKGKVEDNHVIAAFGYLIVCTIWSLDKETQNICIATVENFIKTLNKSEIENNEKTAFALGVILDVIEQLNIEGGESEIVRMAMRQNLKGAKE